MSSCRVDFPTRCPNPHYAYPTWSAAAPILFVRILLRLSATYRLAGSD